MPSASTTAMPTAAALLIGLTANPNSISTSMIGLESQNNDHEPRPSSHRPLSHRCRIAVTRPPGRERGLAYTLSPADPVVDHHALTHGLASEPRNSAPSCKKDATGRGYPVSDPNARHERGDGVVVARGADTGGD